MSNKWESKTANRGPLGQVLKEAHMQTAGVSPQDLALFKQYVDEAIETDDGYIGATGFQDMLAGAGQNRSVEYGAANYQAQDLDFMDLMEALGVQGYEFEGPHGRDGYSDFVVCRSQSEEPSGQKLAQTPGPQSNAGVRTPEQMIAAGYEVLDTFDLADAMSPYSLWHRGPTPDMPTDQYVMLDNSGNLAAGPDIDMDSVVTELHTNVGIDPTNPF